MASSVDRSSRRGLVSEIIGSRMLATRSPAQVVSPVCAATRGQEWGSPFSLGGLCILGSSWSLGGSLAKEDTLFQHLVWFFPGWELPRLNISAMGLLVAFKILWDVAISCSDIGLSPAMWTAAILR